MRQRHELIAATKEIVAAEGIFATEGAACLPALKKLLADGAVKPTNEGALYMERREVLESFS